MKISALVSDPFRIFFVVYFLSVAQIFALGSWNFNDDVRLKCHGISVEEFYTGTNSNVLNDAIGDDTIAYLLATIDFYFHADYGDSKKPRLSFYTDLRFRYYWGSTTETAMFNSNLFIADVATSVKGTRLNKHLLWMREGWLKMVFGSEPDNHNHFLQIGLIPFQLGRGLTLGAAFDAPGFLGFNAGFAIDEYAPAVILSVNPVGDTVVNVYVAIIDNEQTSLDQNYEVIRASEIGAGCHLRGVSEQFFIFAVNNKTCFENKAKKEKVVIEPYLMHLHAPDRNLEFLHDINSDLSTAGLCVEAEFGDINWGFECARNFGGAYIKPWDRNQIAVVKQDNGQLVEQYTKIYDKNPLDPTAVLVDATTTNAYYVNGSPKSSLENGREIGPDLYNGLTRFRPAENFNLSGYFFVADVAYDYVRDFLTGALGVGYFSGYPHERIDLNHADLDACLHQNYTGFVPVQSQYSGTRIRNLIMFNQGISRYTVGAPDAPNPLENSTQPLVTDTLDSTTNIAFIGTRLAWHVQQWKEHKLLIAPNVIGYWSPEVPKIKIPETDDAPSHFLKIGDYLGTEMNIELSMDIIENLKLSGYVGMLLPGSYYSSLKGTYLREHKAKIGDSPVYICDIAISYVF